MQCANDERPTIESARDALILLKLLVFARRRLAFQEQEFSTQQPAAFGAVRYSDLRFGDGCEIGEYFDALAIRGSAIDVSGRAFSLLALPSLCQCLFRRGESDLVG